MGQAGENKDDLPGRHCFQYLNIEDFGVKIRVFLASLKIILLLDQVSASSASVCHSKPVAV